MANATTDDVTMNTLDTLYIGSIETIWYSKKKRPDEHTIHDILQAEKNLIEVRLADIKIKLSNQVREAKKSTFKWPKFLFYY